MVGWVHTIIKSKSHLTDYLGPVHGPITERANTDHRDIILVFGQSMINRLIVLDTTGFESRLDQISLRNAGDVSDHAY